MSVQTGFSSVDRSGRSDDLVGYLALLAERLAGFRREGFELMRLRPGSAVLDVGCGAGEVCVELSERVGPHGRIAGVDLSEVMIDAARRTAEKAGKDIDLRVCSAYSLPFADGSFDAVRAERVFQHLDDPDTALREMLRVTRVGGRVLLFDPDHGQTTIALDDVRHRAVFEAARRALLRMIVNPHSGIRLRSMVLQAGLADIEQTTRAMEVAYPDFARAFFLHELLSNAVGAGEISPDEAERFVQELDRRNRAGVFFATVIGYTVAGTRSR